MKSRRNTHFRSPIAGTWIIRGDRDWMILEGADFYDLKVIPKFTVYFKGRKIGEFEELEDAKSLIRERRKGKTREE